MSQHILVAGCKDQTQDILCELFVRIGMNVTSVSTVENAVRSLREGPSLIIVDLAIGSGNGIDVLCAARQRLLGTTLAVITSGSAGVNLDWIAQCRPDAIFGKPFDFADFADWLSRFDENNQVLPFHHEFGMQRLSQAA